MKFTQKAALVEGPMRKMMVRLTAPMIFGTAALIGFNIVDTYFLGRIGTLPLAAIGFTFPAVVIVTGLSMGTGGGVSAALSRAIGEGDQYKIKRFTTDGLILTFLLSVIMSVGGILTFDSAFRLLKVPPEVMPLIRQYMIIWYAGVLALALQAVLNAIFRAMGNTIIPTMVLCSAMILNMILNRLLIFGFGPIPRMDIPGAAVATVIALAAPLPYPFWLLHFRMHMITYDWPGLKALWHSWRHILFVGIPSAISNTIVPIGAGVITRLVAGYGPESVAALGVASRIEIFTMAVIVALATVLDPFIGQNCGAGKYDRVREAVRDTQVFSLLWGLGIAVIFAAIARPLAAVFSDDPKVISVTVTYLRIVPVAFGLYGVTMLASASMNVLQKPVQALTLVSIHILFLLIPFVFIGYYLFGLPGIFGAIAAARITAGMIARIWLKILLFSEETRYRACTSASDHSPKQ
ncbi:MAG: MATE family efflux transporter [bacterium]